MQTYVQENRAMIRAGRCPEPVFETRSVERFRTLADTQTQAERFTLVKLQALILLSRTAVIAESILDAWLLISQN